VIKFTEPTAEAIQFIADNMRDADIVEVWAAGHHTPIDSLTKSIDISEFNTLVTIDDIPCVLFGLVRTDILSGSGVPWMLGATSIMKHKREILKHSPVVIEQMLTICPNLVNYVHGKNKMSIRWLKWLGFIIEEPVPRGPDNELFHRFHRSLTDV